MSDNGNYWAAVESLRDNRDQWAAFESTGNCVVLAGPGSGKTKTLSTKVARVLAEDVSEPRGIACITYNNECARELENKLRFLGVEPSSRVFIGTVHSFALTQIILPYAKVARLGLPDPYSVATLSQSRAALMRALSAVIGRNATLREWEGPMAAYRRTYLLRNSDEWTDINPRLATLIERYEQELRNEGLIDFDDMPLLAVKALRQNPWLRTALVAKYPVLVVDEYQDLGKPLDFIVMALCFRAGMRLFAVGDPDQSIYGFTGARPELLLNLADRDDVETVRLRVNYRSGTSIIAAAKIALGEDRGYTPTPNAVAGSVILHPLPPRYDQQATWLITNLLPTILSRYPDLSLSDAAVIYPTARIGDDVAAAARAAAVPVLRTDLNALYPRNSRLMQWLEQCALWCCGGWRTGEPAFARVTKEGQRLFAEAVRSEVDLLDFRRALLTALNGTRNGEISLLTWLELLSSLIEPMLATCATLDGEMEMLTAFILCVGENGDASGMLLKDLAANVAGGRALNLSTLHSAKGREFPIVFMFAMDEGRLPWSNVSDRQLAEFRRQFYVGLTRAKYEVHILHTSGNASRFVEELQVHHG